LVSLLLAPIIIYILVRHPFFRPERNIGCVLVLLAALLDQLSQYCRTKETPDMDTAVILSYMVMVILFVFLIGVAGLIAYHYLFYRFVLRGRGWLITEYVSVRLAACSELS